MMRIRPYRPDDAEAISRLIRTTMRISNSNDYPMEKLQRLIDYFSPAKVDEINSEQPYSTSVSDVLAHLAVSDVLALVSYP